MAKNKLAITTFISGRMITGIFAICMSPNCNQQYTARSVAARLLPACSITLYQMFRDQINTPP